MTPTKAQIEAAANAIRKYMGVFTDAEEIAKAALTAAAEVQKNKANWKVCKTCNCWVKRPLEWEPECSEVPDASSKGFFTAAAEVGEANDPLIGFTQFDLNKDRKRVETATIERCCQAVWDVEIEGGLAVGDRGEIVAAIRALKDS